LELPNTDQFTTLIDVLFLTKNVFQSIHVGNPNKNDTKNVSTNTKNRFADEKAIRHDKATRSEKSGYIFTETNTMIVDHRVIEAIANHKWQIAERRSRELFLRSFGEHFGVPPNIVAYLFNRIMTERHADDIRPEHVLWTLYFLKQNPTELVGARFCKCARQTYHDRVWQTITELSHLDVVRMRVLCQPLYMQKNYFST